MLAGCGTNPLDSIKNPFAKEQKKIPGERRDILVSASPTDSEQATGEVKISGTTTLNNWSQPGGPPSNAPGNVALGAPGSTWSVSIAKVGRKGRLTAGPIIHNGLAVMMDNQGNVSSYALTGAGRAWSARLRPEDERSTAPGGGVAADGNIIVAATPYRSIVALNAQNGQVLWSSDLEAPARGAPTAINGKAYVVTADNIVHCFNLEDGTELWSFAGIPQTAGVMSAASPAVGQGRVIVPYTSGEVMAFNTDSGDPVWLDVLAGTSGFTNVSGLNDVAGRPVLYDGTVYAVSVSGRMIAVSAKEGTRLWAANVASSHTPAVSGNTVFASTLEGNLVALDRSTGKIRWRISLSGDKKASWAGPLLAGSRLWLASSDGRIVGIDPVSGEPVYTQNIGKPVYISPISAGGRLYVLDNSGRLTAFN